MTISVKQTFCALVLLATSPMLQAPAARAAERLAPSAALSAGTTQLIHHTVIEAPSPAVESLYQQWVEESEMPTPSGVVHIEERECPEYEATLCALPGRRTIVMPSNLYVFEMDDPRDQLAHQIDFYHELGHIEDLGQDSGPRWYRRAFSLLTHTPRDNYERLATAYAFCSLSRSALPPEPTFRQQTYYGYDPGEALHRQICRALYWNM